MSQPVNNIALTQTNYKINDSNVKNVTTRWQPAQLGKRSDQINKN